MELKRILRTKVTLAFGSKLVLPAGDYEGKNIPKELEEEFELGSVHVEEVVTRVPGEASTKLSGKALKAKAKAEEEAKAKAEEEEAAAQLANADREMAADDKSSEE